MQWLFFEQYYVEPTIGTLRFWVLAGKVKANEALAAAKRSSGERALDALERHLSRHPFLANESYSIADIAVFAYSHLAADAHFDLASRPAFVRWIERVKSPVRARCRRSTPYTPDAMADALERILDAAGLAVASGSFDRREQRAVGLARIDDLLREVVLRDSRTRLRRRAAK